MPGAIGLRAIFCTYLVQLANSYHNYGMSKQNKVWLVLSDLHYPFDCPKYIGLALKLLAKLAKRPNFGGVIQLGDALDFWQISAYDKDPSRRETVLDDILRYSSFLDQCEKLMPKGTVFHQLEGNHESRVTRFTSRNAPQMYQLVKTVPEALLFPDRNRRGRIQFKWHPYKKWNSCIISDTVFHHGFYFSKHVAMQNLEIYPYNFVCGHVHRVQYVSNGRRFSCTLGHGSDCEATMHTPVPSTWEQAMGVFYCGGKRDSIDIMEVKDGSCMFMGEEVCYP